MTSEKDKDANLMSILDSDSQPESKEEKALKDNEASQKDSFVSDKPSDSERLVDRQNTIANL